MGMRIGSIVLALAAAAFAGRLSAQAPTPIRLAAAGGACLPLGPDASSLYGAGAFGEVAAEYRPPRLGALGLGVAVGFRWIPLDARLSARPSLGAATAEFGLGYDLPLGAALVLRGAARAGGFYGALSDSGGFSEVGVLSSWGASLSAGLSLAFAGIPGIVLELDCRYRGLLGLYDGLELGLSGSFPLKARRKAPSSDQPLPLVGSLSLDPPRIGNIYPVFFKYYNDHPLGRLTLRNGGEEAVTDVATSFFMKQYMDAPKPCATIPRLGPGESVELDLYALFTERMLEVTEGTMVAAELAVEYLQEGFPMKAARNEAIRVLDRNAMSWFDDGCAAAYVTAKDPAVLGFAKNVSSATKDAVNPAIDRNLQAAMALHQALDLYGIGYAVDPKSAYAANSLSKETVDFLQFPRQTLEYKAGDCDDLSILYAALLEALGVETAFVTVPGHIYAAVALAASPEELRRSLAAPEEIIERGGRAWLPVEVTERSAGFLAAWRTGAREWREAAEKGGAGFHPVHEAWAVFEPVGLPGSGSQGAPPPA